MGLKDQESGTPMKKPPGDMNVYDIVANYGALGKVVLGEVAMVSKHPTIVGTNREGVWLDFFRRLLPKKFSLVSNVQIIDSYKGWSNEVDIAVIDEQYTPYIFQYQSLKLIPIEAVAMVIECKSTDLKLASLKKWRKSIEGLKASRIGLARTISGLSIQLTNLTQIRTRPIAVLASFSATDKSEAYSLFDFTLHPTQVKENETSFDLKVPNERQKLAWWNEQLNGKTKKPDLEVLDLSYEHIKDLTPEDQKELQAAYGFETEQAGGYYLENTLADLRIKDQPLLTLNLQINQLLMLINNPMLFPHFAYARRLRALF